MPARLLQTNTTILSPVGIPRVEHTPTPKAADRFSDCKMHNTESFASVDCSTFAGVSDQSRREILQSAQHREYRRGQALHREGDLISTVALLTAGSVKVVQYSVNGSAVILRVCGPGDMVGHPTSYRNERHSGTALAMEATEVLLWNNHMFVSLSERFPQLRLNSARTLESHIRDIEDRFREISCERVPTRLAKLLMRLMKKIGSRSRPSGEIHMTCEEISQLIGCSLFTVSRLLSDWDRMGIIRTRRESVQVIDPPALEEMSSKISVLPLRR